jgi:diguanylate cyclase (GGDEF)-like protein
MSPHSAARHCTHDADTGAAWHCAVLEALPVAAFAIDSEHRVTTWNDACARLTGIAAAEMIGTRRAWAGFYPVGATPVLADLIVDRAGADRIASHGGQSGKPSPSKPGAWEGRAFFPKVNRWLSFCASPIKGFGGRIVGAVEVIRDITESVESAKTLEHRTTHDILTGLPNRALARDRLEQALKLARRNESGVALMFIDLDGFKCVNDMWGHQAGDELLKQVVTRLQDCLRAGDTLSRLGGDEFVALLPELTDREGAAIVGERFVAALKAPFRLKDQEVQISASVGAALFPDDATEAESLLSHADTAMYRAKDLGKGQLAFFTDDLKRQIDDRMTIKNGLAKALERQEFELHFQPKSSLSDCRITGFEALLRWRSPSLGLVSPAQFIPILEQTGQIDAVGHWVIEEACRQQSLWRARGHTALRVSVNLSARQLWNPTLLRRVALVLEDHSLDPSALELELTESMIMQDAEHSQALLQGFNEMGIHLSIDDFGTGYSSLAYLKRFPFRTIKIDRSFIADLAHDPDDLEIVKTIVTMGRSLRRNIIAEGVETEQQRLILRHLGCDEMQGYLLSPPLPADEVEKFLRLHDRA